MMYQPQPDEMTLIKDASNPHRQLVVVLESDSRRSLEEHLRRSGVRGCEIYKEQYQELYRLICERQDVLSKPPVE